MVHPALVETAHRPWPLPQRRWSLSMCWEDLLFLHWRVDAAALQSQLPAGLELETFDGTAWLGVVPFRMARTRLRWLPPLPGTGTFPELNVRTYVRAGGRAGVWFFSLDAASRVVVEAARIGFALNYLAACMRCESSGGRVHYRSERHDRRGAAASFAASWHAEADFAPARPGTLEHFLAERYCMFAARRGQLFCGDIAHRPWQLAPASCEIAANDMTRALGCELQGPPASALAAAPLDVVAFSLQRVAPPQPS